MKIRYSFAKRCLSPGAISIFLIGSAVVTTVGVLLFSGIQYFWWYWGWLEFLLAFVWFEGIIVPADFIVREEKFIGGGYITYSRMVLKTFFASLTLWGSCYVLLAFPAVRTIVLCVQICLIILWMLCLAGRKIFFILAALALTPLYFINWWLVAVCIQIVILLQFWIASTMVLFGQQMQNCEIEPLPVNVAAPDEIAVTLRLWANLAEKSDCSLKLKRLAEKIEYSLSSHGKIGVSPEYQALICKINELAGKFNSRDISEIESDVQMIDFMVEQVKKACSR